MFKRILFTVLLVMTVLCCTAMAEEASSDFVFEVGESSVTLTSYTGTETNVTVPGWYQCKPVTVIGASAFEGQSIQSVTLPNSITRIGAGAFRNCKSLSSIDTYNDVQVHTWGDGVYDPAPDCGHEGTLTRKCLYCDATQTSTVPATGEHAYDGGVVTTPATCTSEGVMTFTCTVCGHTRTAPIAKLEEHPWDEGKVTTEPGCETVGVMTFTCTSCGATRTEEIPANGHTWDEGVRTTEPGCETVGVMTFTCAVCQATKTGEIAATGHTYSQTIVAPTCTEKGYTLHTCASCGGTRQDNEVEALGHAWDAGVVTTPTCVDEGFTLFTCQREGCGATEKRDVQPATGNHTWDNGVITKPPTDTEPGIKLFTCKVCGATKEEIVEPGTIIVVPGDVNEDGKIDGRDVIILQRHLIGMDVTVNMANADMNGDGKLDGRDVILLLRKLIGL